MTFDEQRMVPQTKQYGDIKAKIDQLKTQDQALPELTPSQAWAWWQRIRKASSIPGRTAIVRSSAKRSKGLSFKVRTTTGK
jgi:hypothetical protein